MPINTEKNNFSQIKSVSALHGWHWINESLRYFLYAKYTWLLLTLILAMNLMLMAYALPILLVFVAPFAAAGLSMACADIEKGQKISVEYLFKGFTVKNRLNLLRYGFWMILLMIMSQVVSTALLNIYGVSQEQILSEINNFRNNSHISFQSILDSPVLFKYFAVTFLVLLPITAINLFAPIILTFSQLSAFQAIRLSITAVGKNISAIIIYALVYLVILAIGIWLINLLSILLLNVFSSIPVVAGFLSLLLLMLFMLGFLTLAYCSAYVAFKDVFLGEKI